MAPDSQQQQKIAQHRRRQTICGFLFFLNIIFKFKFFIFYSSLSPSDSINNSLRCYRTESEALEVLYVVFLVLVSSNLKKIMYLEI